MQLSIDGKQIDVGDALRDHVENCLSDSVAKYFGNPVEAHVVFSREGQSFRADVQVHVGRGISAQSHADTEDPHTAFDTALEKVAKQLRRHNRKLHDHHARDKGGHDESGEAAGDD